MCKLGVWHETLVGLALSMVQINWERILAVNSIKIRERRQKKGEQPENIRNGVGILE